MATFAAVASLISGIVGAGGAIISANASANAAEAAAQAEAEQRRRQANEARAVSQREAIRRKREARLVQSRQLAVSSASGGAAGDPTVVRLMADTGAQGEYNAASAIYEGEARGRAFEYAGQMALWQAKEQGRQAKMASYINAGTSILSGLSGFAEKGGTLPRLKKTRMPLDLNPASWD